MPRRVAAALVACLVTTKVFAAQDEPGPLLEGIPKSPASPLMDVSQNGEPCAFGAVGTPLILFEAVTRSLCRDPKTREAWAGIRVRATQVMAGKENYFPTISGSWQDIRQTNNTHVRDVPVLSTDSRSVTQNTSLSLSWVLYDFGRRGAQLENARDLLAAAQANLDVNLQQAFVQAAKDYYDAQAAQASRNATARIEQSAAESEGAARARVSKGVAAISDQLQARTAHAQAIVNRVKADGDFRTKLGALAIDMGLDPDRALELPMASDQILADSEFSQSLRELIEDAKRAHPSVVQAEKELAAAVASEKAARRQGLPSFSFIAKSTRSNQPISPSLGQPPLSATQGTSYFGLQVDVPLSDALLHRAPTEQARAQVELQRETLNEAEQQVAQTVWNSYQILQTNTDNLSNSEILLSSAEESFDASQKRYKGGAGNILELLNAQSALASAQQQRIQALSDWRVARLQLAASLGKLGAWSIEPANGSPGVE